SLFKPVSVKTDPATGAKVRRRSKKWYVKFRDARGRLCRKPGFTDKEATRNLAHKIQTREDRIKAGLPVEDEEQAARPLAEHLAEFEASLQRKNRGKPRSAKHVRLTLSRLRRIVAACGFGKFTDISASRVEQFLADLCAPTLPGPALDPAKTEYTRKEI